jgi:hypothetical protein
VSDWSASVTVRVRGHPPTAAISARPLAGYVSTGFAFSSLSYEGSGSISELAWSFGDGRGARGEQANHAFSAHGDFLVTLTVRDDAGLSAQASVMVRVWDSPPMPAISMDRGSAPLGEPILFSGRGSSDPDDPLPNLTYAWDFGDGQRALGVNASYAFRSPGIHRVVLTVSDGNQSAERAVDVQVGWKAAAAVQKPGPGWPSWAILAALLAAAGLLLAAMMIPDDKRKRGEEEE